MKEHFKIQGEIFGDLYSRYGYKRPFFYSLNHHYDLCCNELYKPMVCLRDNYGVTTTATDEEVKGKLVCLRDNYGVTTTYLDILL